MNILSSLFIIIIYCIINEPDHGNNMVYVINVMEKHDLK